MDKDDKKDESPSFIFSELPDPFMTLQQQLSEVIESEKRKQVPKRNEDE